MKIGKKYFVTDNSYITCLTTGEQNTSLIPWMSNNKSHPHIEEFGATFTTVTSSYLKQKIGFYKEKLLREFIQIKSSITNNIYEVLYIEDNLDF